MALTTQEAKPPPPDLPQNMENNAPETGQPVASGGAESVNVWERPWSVDEMRKAANDWSLAGDAGMLQYLQDFSQRIISRTHDIQEQVNGLVHESKLTGIRVQSAFNDFIMLANTQFVENRVYDDDVNTETNDSSESKEEKEKTREEREAALIPKIVDAMKLGFNVIDTAFEKLDVNDVNSDSEDEEESPYKTDTILEPKDPYLSRALPYLIGSQAFMTDDDVGLNDVLSEEDESDRGSLSTSDSGTEDESELEEEPRPTRKPTLLSSDSDSGSDSETDSELFGSKDDNSDAEPQSEDEQIQVQQSSEKPSFANELSAKLGAPTSSGVKEKKERSVSKSKVPKEEDDEDLFGPPPVEDEDSPFSKKGGLFSSGGGLFDDDENEGGLFDDVIVDAPRAPASRQRKESSESNQEEEEAKQKEPTSRPRTKSGRKVPVGAVSIFGGGDDDLFGTEPQTAESEPPPDGDYTKPSSHQEAKTSAARPSPAPFSGGGLFDDDGDDLFATAPVKKQATKEASAATPGSELFADDNEDGDLFAAPPAKAAPPAQTVPKANKKKLPPGAVSMFGANSNPLAAAIKAQRPASDKEESDEDWEDQDKASQSSGRSGTSVSGLRPVAAATKDVSPSESSNSLFAEEPQDDLFVTTTSKPKLAASKLPAKGLFRDDSDEEDLFAATSKPKTAEAPTTKARAPSLFLDDEDEGDGGLFATKPPAKDTQTTKTNPANTTDLFTDDLPTQGKGQPPPKKEPEPKAASTTNRVRTSTALSLFDDDAEDDLFGRTPPPPPSETGDAKGGKPHSRSLFADEDMLFGGSAEEDPAIDLFGASSPLSPSKGSKPFPLPGAEPASPPGSLQDKVEVKGATTSASSTDLFTGTDVFTPPTLQQDPTLEVRGATVSESSTDKVGKMKKPVGGVSMFGGIDPTAILKRRTGSAASTPEGDQPQPPELPVGSPNSDANFMSAPKPEVKSTPSTAPKPVRPTRSTSIGKLQANLDIQPSSLLPRAAPPVRAPAPVSAGFDHPVRPTTLHTVQKDRVRGQTRRRPPTRKSRVLTSGSDLVNGEGESPHESWAAPPADSAPRHHPALPSRPNPQRDLFGDDGDDVDFGASSAPTPTRPEPTVSGAKAPQKDPSPATQPAALPKATSDIFSAAFAKSKGSVSKVRSPLENDNEDRDDLFSGVTKKPEKKVIVDISEDLFETAVSKPSTAPSSRTAGMASGQTKPVTAEPAPRDDVGDIFAELAQPKKPTPRPQTDDLFSDDIFSPPAATRGATKKPTMDYGVDEEEDVFATATVRSSATKKQPKAAKKPDSALEDNIFADLPPAKTREKKGKKKPASEAKSIFDDDVDDIFAEAAAKPKPKKMGTSKKKLDTLDADIFGQNDDTDNIFDDPLSAMKH